MTTSRSLPLPQEWKERLGLAGRNSPELYESSEAVIDVPHALAIRTTFDDLRLSAMFCVQGIPTVAILSVEQYERTHVIDLHAALWNQGLGSLLLVIAGSTLRAFSLSRKPYKDSEGSFDQRCLVDTLEYTADALQIRNMIYGVESGRLWKDYSEFFQTKERIDQVLLDNLKEAQRLLCHANITSNAAHALLLQAMFIAYLEDRDIITPEYFHAVAGNDIDSFMSLLATGNATLLNSLFMSLRNDFNGDIFVAPCSFEPGGIAPKIEAAHLDILARFRAGREEMGQGGQLRLRGYDFRYIPIELVSAVYDRFLGEQKEVRREQGAYYTPMFLADTVVSQVWELLPPEAREQGRYLDPACGSGVFLVRLFQRLCEHWRATHRSRTIHWDNLLMILQRVHGWDMNGSAVRVTVFSLYVALLEEVSPPDIRRLIKGGRILPEIWSKTLVCRDFFDVPETEACFHVIVGNPPWASRRGSGRTSVRWCEKNHLPMPSGEDAWAFAWKAVRHLASDGVIAFLLPAMGFLHNCAANAVDARNQFILENRIRQIINFADLRFQLFEHAHRPAALIIYGMGGLTQFPYRFDYWAPKADLNLQLKRRITLSSTDKLSMSATTAMDYPLVFKQRLWMREPDGRLFAYLSRFPKIGDLIEDYGGLRRRKQNLLGRWIVGQGFQPFNDQPGREEPSSYSESQYVGKLPYLPISLFRRLAQPISGLAPWPSRKVRRHGFEAGFKGARILIPRGVETSRTRLRATYSEDDLTFQDIIQSVTVPPSEKYRGMLLTALLNSRIAIWYAFHGTASFGSDRPEVKQAELLHLPFPSPKDLPEPELAEDAARSLVAIVDGALQSAKEPITLDSDNATLLRIDQLAYQYFCLSDDEIVLIEDTVEKIIPAVQPHKGSYPDLWRSPTESDRRAYASTLVASIRNWLRNNAKIGARLEASSADLGILRLSLNGISGTYTEEKRVSLADALSRISDHIHQPLDGNFQLVPDLRVFIGKDLYLVKPMQLRFWLRSTALADADAIAMDLQDAVSFGRQWSQS
ncbi:MAG: N-6 DNA methylase [Syntrophobacter sp.]